MSKNKEFSNTSAQRYSLALYELSNEENSLETIENNSLTILKLISSCKDFNKFIKDPTGNQKDLILVMNKISDNFKIDKLFNRFLIFLIKKRRFFYLEKILKNFIEICSEKRGEIKAEIESAKALSNEEINKINEDIVKNFSSKINLQYKHNESLIGGLILKVGSIMIDNSIKKKLQQIENRMMEAWDGNKSLWSN